MPPDHENLVFLIHRRMTVLIKEIQELGAVAHLFPSAALTAVSETHDTLASNPPSPDCPNQMANAALVRAIAAHLEAAANDALTTETADAPQS